VYDHQQRISAKEAMSHPFFQDVQAVEEILDREREKIKTCIQARQDAVVKLNEGERVVDGPPHSSRNANVNERKEHIQSCGVEKDGIGTGCILMLLAINEKSKIKKERELLLEKDKKNGGKDKRKEHDDDYNAGGITPVIPVSSALTLVCSVPTPPDSSTPLKIKIASVGAVQFIASQFMSPYPLINYSTPNFVDQVIPSILQSSSSPSCSSSTSPQSTSVVLSTSSSSFSIQPSYLAPHNPQVPIRDYLDFMAFLLSQNKLYSKVQKEKEKEREKHREKERKKKKKEEEDELNAFERAKRKN
jgi:hypothetical protein